MRSLMDVPPQKQYDLIVADPPWRYRDSATRGAAQHHYPTMSLPDLQSLIVPVKEEALLLLWATGPLLDDAIALMHAWGFAYVSVLFVWLKTTKSGTPRTGMGHYTRSNCEFVLLGRRGNRGLTHWVRNHAVPQLIKAEPREHSRKPDEFFVALDALLTTNTLDKLEMFAREKRPGWDAWGDEINRFPRLA